MAGVLVGFAIVGSVILVGYIVGRIDLLGEHAPRVISRLVFFVLTPCLLFTVIAESDVQTVFSSLLAISAISAVVAGAAFIAIVTLFRRFFGRRSTSDLVVGAMSSGYTNANNIGLPVAVYVLGSGAYVAPVILLQVVVFTPIVLTILDATTAGRVSLRRVLLQPVRNPLIIASVLGVLVAIFHVKLPTPVLEPFHLIGAAAVPLVLISFGMSLHGRKLLDAGSERKDLVLATILKLAVMPFIAWMLGAFVFHVTPEHLFAVVVLAGLPTAQNVFNYAQRYDRGVALARDAVLVTTIGSVAVLVVVAALLR